MTLAFAISMYLVIWWIVLFAILPIGVHAQSDDGNIVPGTAESAPHNPHLLPKLLGTTVVAITRSRSTTFPSCRATTPCNRAGA